MHIDLLSAKDVAKHLGISRSTVWRFVAAGKLPQPIKISDRCSRWKATDLERLIEQAHTA